jgi:hypothetical protein
MWVFYHKNQGHTVWYYIAVIFKAVFGDLQVIKKIYVIKEKKTPKFLFRVFSPR